MITIKPHHFIDIIKLYGAGIGTFVPDTAYQHDFYRIANEIIGNMDTVLQLTVYGDDICKPCNRYNGKECTDPLDCIQGFCRKETYNQTLDTRLLTLLVLNTDETYTARAILDKMWREKSMNFLVWQEERELTETRNALFQKGCEKLLAKFSDC